MKTMLGQGVCWNPIYVTELNTEITSKYYPKALFLQTVNRLSMIQNNILKTERCLKLLTSSQLANAASQIGSVSHTEIWHTRLNGPWIFQVYSMFFSSECSQSENHILQSYWGSDGVGVSKGSLISNFANCVKTFHPAVVCNIFPSPHLAKLPGKQ